MHSAKGKWVDELPGILWAYKTTSQRPTRVSPFSLTYGMEAIIPTEIEMPKLRIAHYQQRMANLNNRHIKLHAFRVGDLVLRRAFENTTDLAVGKFQPNWEGPYVIVRVGLAGLYALNKLDRAPTPRIWNVMHLKMYYQ